MIFGVLTIRPPVVNYIRNLLALDRIPFLLGALTPMHAD